MLLITGGTGFIGGHLVRRLARPVRCLVRRRSAELPAGVEPALADLSTGDGVAEALRGVDTVIHIAGVTKALGPRDYYAGNVRASEVLARAAAGRALRFVHVSSLAAAGPSPDGTPVSEDDAPHPVSHYGRSKLEGERIVRELVPEAVVVRPPVVYGPRDTGVLQIFRQIANGLALEIAGPEHWFSIIHVDDLVEGILAAAHHPDSPGRTYFLAHPEPVSWSDLGALAARVMAVRRRAIRVPAPVAYAVGYAADIWSHATRTPGIISRDKVTEARCRYWTCDTRRAARELGFEARTPLEAGLTATIAWYKEAGWLKY